MWRFKSLNFFHHRVFFLFNSLFLKNVLRLTWSINIWTETKRFQHNVEKLDTTQSRRAFQLFRFHNFVLRRTSFERKTRRNVIDSFLRSIETKSLISRSQMRRSLIESCALNQSATESMFWWTHFLIVRTRFALLLWIQILCRTFLFFSLWKDSSTIELSC
jgi:hypothetical protein